MVVTHEHLHKQTKKDVGHGLRRAAINTAVITGTLMGSQVLHENPTFLLNHNVPAIDGIGQALYNSADAVGGLVGHLPGVDFLPHLLSQTPVNSVLHENLLNTVEVYGAISTFRHGVLRAGRKSVSRNIAHANEAHGGKHLDNAPDAVKRHVKGMTALRGVMTAADLLLETGETVADGPVPWGFRDLDSLGFLAAGWHPLVGEMTKPDKVVLGASIAAPFIPPVIPMSIWAALKHVFKPSRG